MEPNITLDVTRDLSGTSHLRKLLASSLGPGFGLASELASFSGKPIGLAAGSGRTAVSITAPGQWKTTTGISFTLTPTAKCAISVDKSSSSYAVAKSISSTETQKISVGPVAGKVYINIDLDFSITGEVSGAGSVSGVGISGQASGSVATTFSYCQPVDENTETLTVIKDAFSRLVFPFEPDCALTMPEATLARVSFVGCLAFGLNVSYGLGNYKFSAPSVDASMKSYQIGMERFTPPDYGVQAGATASFSYNHTDQFEAIVIKTSAVRATLHLLRSEKNVTQESAGVSVQVSEVKNFSATIDKDQLAKSIDRATKVAGAGAKATPLVDKLQSSLVDKSNQWLHGKNTDTGLTLTLSQQRNRALLYSYAIDLDKANVAQQSWTKFAKGDLAQAVKLGGMTLLPGSGVGDELQRSVCVDLHCFNLFKVSDTSTYFRNSYTEVGPAGDLRYLYDIGNEVEVDTKTAMHKCRFHFVSTAALGANNTVQAAEVDLYIELSESINSSDAHKLAAIIAPLGATVSDAQTRMGAFVDASKKATLNLITIFKPSAYQRLTSSPYTTGKPPANPQTEDIRNFAAFHMACISLEQWPFLAALSYSDWARFNEYSNNVSTVVDNNPKAVPDRRSPGNPHAVPEGFFVNREADKVNIAYYYENCAAFMNLCEDLHNLSRVVGKLDVDKTEAEWQDLLQLLTHLVKNSLQADFSKPAACALLQLCQGAAVSTNLLPSADKQSFTCTLILS